jgi:hypothetical protein
MAVMNSTTNATHELMKALNFGVEVEVVGTTRANLARAIQSVVGGTVTTSGPRFLVTDTRGRVWKVEPDASLSGGEFSGEVVSPILEYADMDELQRVVRALREHRARVDSSTGIHIHVDGRSLDAKSTLNLVNIMHKQERLIEAALQVRPDRLSRYCRSIDPEFIARLDAKKPKTMEELATAWYGYENRSPNRYCSTRYHGLNLNSLFVRGTVEYRSFNGSLHAGEIKAYVQLVLAMTAKAIKAKGTQRRKRDIDPATSKYDFRVFLLGLGFIGAEFKTARHHLTKHLGGSAAWKGARRDKRKRAA